MAEFTSTTNYGFKKPTIGEADGNWGTYLNDNWTLADTTLQSIASATVDRSLESLNNVTGTASAGDFLVYTSGNWTTTAVSIPSVVNDLSDVNISNIQSNDVLSYNATTGKWENSSTGSTTISDGDVTNSKLSTTLQAQIALILQTTGTPADNQIVKYSASAQNWSFANIPGGSVSVLTDVSAGSVADGHALIYNSSTSKWTSQLIAISSVSGLQTALNGKFSSTGNAADLKSESTVPSGYVLTADGVGEASWQANGGISNGDKGDILVTGSGATWTIDADAVTYGKIQDVSATDKILGRSSSGSGVIEEITCTSVGRNLLDDADVAAQRSTLGLGTAATTAATAYATAAQGTKADSALQDAVDDTSPQLGGNLDVNGQSIVSVSAGNIAITPHTTGKIVLDGLSWPTADGSGDQVIKTDGSGNLSFVDQSGGGISQLEHSASISSDQIIASGKNRLYIGPISVSADVTVAGKLVILDGNYSQVSGTTNITGNLNLI